MKYKFVPLSLSGALTALAFALVSEADGLAEDAVREQASVTGSDQGAMPGVAGSYLAARYAGSRGDERQASFYYDHALAYDPHNIQLMKDAIRMHVVAGNVADAAVIAGNLKKFDVQNQLGHLVLLLQQVKQGDIEAARQEVEAIKPYGLFSIVRPLLVAWLDTASGEVPGEIAYPETIRHLEAFKSFLSLQHALMYDMAGESDRAAPLYHAASQALSGGVYRHMLLIADFYRRRGQDQEATTLLERFQEENPAAMIGEGVTLAQLYRDMPAETSERVIDTSADALAELLYALAGLLYGDDASAETRIYLQLALHLRPDHQAGLLMMGNILEENEDWQQALVRYETVGGRGPFYRRARIRSAYCLEKLGKTRQALAQLDQLTQDMPLSSNVLIMKGDIYRKHEQFNAAAKAYETALSLHEGEFAEHHWPVFFARGISYERDGQWGKAEQDFNAALELYPGQPDVLNYLGYSWLMQGTHLEKARALLEQAITERPEDGHIIDSLGWALYMLEDYPAAVTYLEQAVDLMPHDPVVNEHLGDALWRVKRRTEARFQWERALIYGPEEKARKAIEKKLHQGLHEGGSQVEHQTSLR